MIKITGLWGCTCHQSWVQPKNQMISSISNLFVCLFVCFDLGFTPESPYCVCTLQFWPNSWMWSWHSPKILNFSLRLVPKSNHTMNLFSNSLYHGWQRKADDQGQAHGHLCEAPSSSKVSCPHFFIDVHFQSVSVAPIADAIDPAEHDITTVQSAQYDIKDMKKYKRPLDFLETSPRALFWLLSPY